MNTIDSMQKSLIDGRLSRRQFIERMAAMGAVAAIPGALQSAAAATPKRGGRLRVGAGGGATTDSLQANAGYCCPEHTAFLQYALRNPLIVFDAQMVPQGELLESWDVAPGATRWTLRLRKGVEFHNGKTLDAEDVIHSINLHRGEDSTSPVNTLVKPIADLKADGKHTVVVTLEAGNADFVAVLSAPQLMIVPAGYTGWNDGMGTGPFVLQRFDPGVRAFATRHPNYFKEGKPWFDEVELIAINDPSTKTNALRTGEVDLIDHPDLKTIDLLKQAPGVKVVTMPGMRHFTAPMRTDRAPFDNNDVRLALKYAVDREALVEKLLRGYGTVGNDHPIARINRFFAADLPQREYDPDKARFHLEKAGLAGHKFELHASEAAFPSAIDMGVLIRESALAAGIDIEVVREPADGYWSDIWRNAGWCFSYWSGRPTEDWMFTQAYAAGAAWNESFWAHERFNELLVAARTELDDTKRSEMYAEMQQLCSDEGGSLVPVFNDQVMAMSDKIGTPEHIAAHRHWDGYQAADKWWFV